MARIYRALNIDWKMPEDVAVMIVDNGFVGYKIDPNSELDGDSTFLPSKNYPKNFFFVEGGDRISPFVDEDEDITLPLDPESLSPDPKIAEQERVRHGHGTHIAGIILGGMYDDDRAPANENNQNLFAPSVRRLLLSDPELVPGQKPPKYKSWIRLSFVTVRYGVGAEGADPLTQLKEALSSQGTGSTKIVNMSLGRTLTSLPSNNRIPDEVGRETLIVAAAGNSRSLLSMKEGVKAMPAMLRDDGRMLVVASHDANGRLSSFSNFGPPVNIAAPGCNIRSWLDADGKDRALSGTSMATAVVSFAAAMVRSRWGKATAVGLRNRLLASARYEKDLDTCAKVGPELLHEFSSRPYCVRNGAMLDIEAALLVTKDFIEFQECEDPSGTKCVTKTAVGRLINVPEFILKCDGIRPLKIYAGLSRNGAIKKMSDGRFLVGVEGGLEVGAEPLTWSECAPPAGEQLIEFEAEGEQLQGDPATPAKKLPAIELSRLVRLVTKASK